VSDGGFRQIGSQSNKHVNQRKSPSSHKHPLPPSHPYPFYTANMRITSPLLTPQLHTWSKFISIHTNKVWGFSSPLVYRTPGKLKEGSGNPNNWGIQPGAVRKGPPLSVLRVRSPRRHGESWTGDEPGCYPPTLDELQQVESLPGGLGPWTYLGRPTSTNFFYTALGTSVSSSIISTNPP